MPPPVLIDPATVDPSKVLFDKEAIRALNPHRFHMEHLDAIIMMDLEKALIAGYKDVRKDEFWVSGHMPGYPILPGVIMCEAAAQMVSFFTKKLGIFEDNLLGLGGLEEARFRHPVRPGDRLLIVGKGTRVTRRQTIFQTQGFVDGKMAFEVTVIGVPIPGGDQIQNESAEKALARA